MTNSGERRSSTEFAQSNASADAASAARLREEFAEWLRRYFALDPTKASDVLLAVNEALANAAEFAYAGADRPGAVHMRADYDCATAVLTVTVADEGAWRIANARTKTSIRGRGIPLMRALADHSTIESSPGGTTVRLAWEQIIPAAQSAVTDA